ncbi:MAG TPA: hypothetical protein VMQ62_06285 [Dongiaceae bacterium]|nr:hypothetical protein [Dongiaceae bacterium]
MNRPQRRGAFAGTTLAAGFGLLLVARLAASVTVAQDRPRPMEDRAARPGLPVVHEISGSVPAGPQRLRIDTAIGSVRLRPAGGDDTVYKVRLRSIGAADAAEARRRIDRMTVSASRSGDLLHFTGSLPPDPDAARGLTAEFDIEVPAAVRVVEVATGAGDIDATGLHGRLVLTTLAGAITGGDLGGPIEAETHAGRIAIGAVGADARLTSAGGDVLLDDARGAVIVRTSGGDVRIGRAGTLTRVDSGGGNVRIEQAGGVVRVATGGGDIDVRNALGEVSAATAGGGIRVGNAPGVRCETAAGPIVLGSVDGPIRAISSAGNINALFDAASLKADSDIQTWRGDVVVAIPEDLAVTVRALVDNPVGRSIQSDYPLNIQRDLETAGRPLEMGEARLLGGGPLLKLRTLGGRIVIRKVSKTTAAVVDAAADNQAGTEAQ